MSATLIHFFGNGTSEHDTDPKRLIAPQAKAVLGGKGSSLHAMTAFGLPVPPGFTIITDACRHFYENDRKWPDGLADQVAVHLTRLEAATGRKYGDPERPLLVSVRSGAADSMPGMMDTVLNVGDPKNGDPQAQLRKAIDDVFSSWMNERAIAYRKEKKITGLAGTAVNVQAMCPAEIAGVLFTINANTGKTDEMVIEAVPGLGESLVLGEVVPDNYIVSRPDWSVKMSRPAKEKPILSDAQLAELGALGAKVEDYYGYALDIEWALEGGKFFLLQARKAKSTAVEQESLRVKEIERLRKETDGTPTVWSRFNLSETLPRPLPMTWSIMRRFMSPLGGQGTLLRRHGYTPGLGEDKSVLELICGRLFNNLNHDAQMYFGGYPYGHDFAALKKDPSKALFPRPELDRSKLGFFGKLMFWFKALKVTMKTGRARATVADRLEQELFPALRAEHAQFHKQDLSKLSEAELIALVHERVDRFWQNCGADAFEATLLADFSLEQLRIALKKGLGDEEGEKLLQRAVSAGIHSTTGDTNEMLVEVAAGRKTIDQFLDAHGHRAAGELELSVPRWREDRAEVEHMLSTVGTIDRKKLAGFMEHAEKSAGEAGEASPGDPHETDPIRKEITERCGFVWGPQACKELEQVRRYFAFRETAKHYVMYGYELIRAALVELDHRWGLHGGIFYLEEAELDTAGKWPDIKDRIAQRKHERDLVLKIPLPDVIFSDALEQIGNPPPPPASKEFAGLAVSPGMAEGPARLVFDPHTDRPVGKGYILVCPSTDPGWTPLFVNAAGLVLERGGMLSHGSLVAREFGLPAVAGIDQITRAVRDGMRIRVDGDKGKVYLLED